MSAYICKVCKSSSDEIKDFILCRGKCKKYLHYHCACITEERFRKMPRKNKRKWKCIDCRVQKRSNTATRQHLESDSGNSLSSDIGYVEDCLNNHNSILPNTKNELNAFRQELTQTVESLEHLREVYNKMALKVDNFEQEMKVQTTNLKKLFENVRKADKTLYTLGQNVRDDRLEIHGLILNQFPNDDINETIVEVGKCFDVEFTVKDIGKVDIVLKNPQKPVLVVHFVSKEIRDKLLSARKKKNLIAYKSGNSVLESSNTIYINENLSPHLKCLSYQARQLARKKNFKFVWVKDGNLFIRKDPGSQRIRITCKEDLDRLEAN